MPNTLNTEIAEEILTLKNKIIELENRVSQLDIVSSLKIPLAQFANDLSISRQTLTYHVKQNYKPQVDFYFENNRILLNVGILNSIKEYYNAK